MRVSPSTLMLLIKRGFRHLRFVLIHWHDINRAHPSEPPAGIFYHPNCDCFEVEEDEHGKRH